MKPKNIIEECEGYAKLIIKGIETYIDIEDIDKISSVTWRFTDNGYIRNNKLGRLHRYLMNCPDDMVVDHINGNKLDNRKCNLRICTHSENNANRKPYGNKNLPKGVVKKGNKYRAIIYHNKRRINIGYYDTVEQAQQAYEEKAHELFGEYSYKESQELSKENEIETDE